MHYFCSTSRFLIAALTIIKPHVSIADNAKQSVYSVVDANECVVQAISLLVPPEDVGNTGHTEFEHVEFVCEFVGSEKTLPIELSDGQKKTMSDKLESGELISNVSTLSFSDLGDTVKISDDAIHLSPEANVASALGKGDVARAQGKAIGKKNTLVVRVTDSKGRVVPQCAAQVGDDIFGSRGDPINLKSQMYLCSYGQTDFIAGDPPTNSAGNHEVAPGVIEVTIPLDLTQGTRAQVRDAVTAAVNSKLGFNLPGPYDHVLYVLKDCYKECTGWVAYAFVNGWLSVYRASYYGHAGVLMHELGHNFNLAHSGQGTAVYNDHTCSMGNPLFADDLGKMCFNGAKSWQLGWYDSNTHTFKKDDGSWLGTIVGVADYKNNPNNSPVVIKLETGTSNDYFVAFNRASGINSQNDEADNMVTIVQTGANGEGYSQSWLKAKLSRGKSYSIGNFAGTGQTLKIIVRNIVTSSCGGYADIDICLSGKCAPTASPTKAPTPKPSCVSGEMAVMTSAPGNPHGSVTKVKDLQIGDTVRGYDTDMNPTTCKVEAIGSFGEGEVYGNYTSDHYVFNPATGLMQQHGETGTATWEEKFDLIADCPLVEDEVGKRFSPLDSDFCGGSMKDISWKEYLMLHSAILNVVRESGAFWFRGSTYGDMEMVKEYAPRVCRNMVKCMKDRTKCKALEKVSRKFMRYGLTDSAKVKARKTFTRVGSPCEKGSVSAIVTSGKTVDESLAGTAAWC